MDEITSGKFSAMADKVTDALGRVKDAISSAIERIKEWNNTTVKEKVFSIKERITRIISTVTGGAASNFSGTSFFPGGLTMVGELGPELVALPRGSRIYNDYETKKLLGKNQEITQHITINSPTPLTPAETVRRIKNASRQLALEW
jgi:phage-related protein